MRFARCLSLIPAALLLATTHAAAQGILDPIAQVTGSSVIGPDGTYYALVPGANSTFQNPSTDLEAVTLTGSSKSEPAWTANLTGRIGQVLPGLNNVYVVETTTSGSGRNTTSTTSVVPFPTSGANVGKPGTAIVPAGNIVDIEVRTIMGTDYLYIYTITSSSSTSGGSTTTTTTRTLTIYTGTALYETVTL